MLHARRRRIGNPSYDKPLIREDVPGVTVGRDFSRFRVTTPCTPRRTTRRRRLPIVRILLPIQRRTADEPALPGYHFHRPSVTTDGSRPLGFLLMSGAILN